METNWPLDRALDDAELMLAIGEAIRNPRGYGPNFQASVEELAGKLSIGGRGQQDQTSLKRFREANPGLDERLQEQAWRLVGLGFLVPITGTTAFRATQRGRVYFETLDPAAIIRGGLDEAMNRLGYAFDDLPRLYARLSQDCFLDGHNEASIVMLGCAAEWFVNSIADRLDASRLVTSVKRPRPSSAAKDLTWLKDILENRTERSAISAAMRRNSKPTDWIDNLRHSLSGAGEAIRMTRNDYAHPTGFTADRDKVLGLMAVFPPFASACSQALDALS